MRERVTGGGFGSTVPPCTFLSLNRSKTGADVGVMPIAANRVTYAGLYVKMQMLT